MRKKCAQVLDSVWKKLWDTRDYTQSDSVQLMHVNKNTVLHSVYTGLVHMLLETLSISWKTRLSTSPTGPTITTLFFKNTLVNHRGGVV